MKKLLIITLLVVIVPFLCIKLFVRTDTIEFKYITNNFIRVKDVNTNKISEIPFEDYIKGVVAAEVPANFEKEALKAQAVASRSYAMYHMDESKEYDVTNNTSSQAYYTDEQLKEKWKDEYVTKISKIKEAVSKTAGEYLTYDGKVANTMFFSTSTGVTENSEDVFVSALPYLRSVASTWDEQSPAYTDSYTFSLTDFYTKLNLPYDDKLEIKVLEKSSTGRTKTLLINNQTFKGRDVATKLKLRSNYFEIVRNESNVTITTKGFGHGVGMSQYGANGMAKEGYKYDQILKYYYKNTEIKKI